MKVPRTHARVPRDGFNVPLLGIPASEVMDECQQCGQARLFKDLQFNLDGSLRCPKCRCEPEPARVASYDGTERTVTLQFEFMPCVRIGDEWLVTPKPVDKKAGA